LPFVKDDDVEDFRASIEESTKVPPIIAVAARTDSMPPLFILSFNSQEKKQE
jgi:hypothetical protein